MGVGSSYRVSALRRRPRHFGEVVGQKHITETLEKSIASKKIPQAMLFCGPRGVGKTTCARILAREANGWGDKSEAELDGLTDIHELDAASNNSVDDVRDLIEQIRYAPVKAQYKIYVIDEVHMFSKSAFNAFLKTLEEPPKYVIFILATTEKHKVLATIISRCQVFDFKPLTRDAIQSYLVKVAKEDGVKYEDSILSAIAKHADGAMRDALSLYDVLLACAGEKGLTQKGLAGHWYFLDEVYFFTLTEKIKQKTLNDALVQLDEAVKEGVELRYFLVEWSHCIRDLLLALDERTLPLLEGRTAQQRATYAELASRLGRGFLLRALDRINQALLQHRDHLNQRLGLEVALVEMADWELASSSPETSASARPQPAAAPVPSSTPSTSVARPTPSSAPPAIRSTPRVSSEPKATPDKPKPPPSPTAETKNYSDSERFQALKAQYPVLNTLADQLDLKPKM